MLYIYGEVIFHAACFFRCACISRRIIGKNTQGAVRHGQARVSGGFSHTLPILAGFLFLGFAYGLLMRTKGFSFLHPMCMAMTIFGGSLEYITVSMLLIFGLCDETFSITCSADVPPEVDRGWFYLWVTVLDWYCWVAGAALGGLLGGLFPFDTKGLDFVMTAMFVVIFVDNLLKEKQHWSSLIGIAGGTIVYMLLVQMM